MKTSSLQLLPFTDFGGASGNYDGTSSSFSGTAVKAAAYASSIGDTQTVGIFTEDFIGTMTIEATLDTTITDSSWFTVHTFNGDGSSANDSTARFFNTSQNITGRYTWMRVTISSFTQGTIHKVTLSY
jgi:hypothetical protein